MHSCYGVIVDETYFVNSQSLSLSVRYSFDFNVLLAIYIYIYISRFNAVNAKFCDSGHLILIKISECDS